MRALVDRLYAGFARMFFGCNYHNLLNQERSEGSTNSLKGWQEGGREGKRERGADSHVSGKEMIKS